jgi:hypothetical protein
MYQLKTVLDSLKHRVGAGLNPAPTKKQRACSTGPHFPCQPGLSDFFTLSPRQQMFWRWFSLIINVLHNVAQNLLSFRVIPVLQLRGLRLGSFIVEGIDMQHTKFFATLAAVGLLASGSACAAIVSGFDTNLLPRSDDGYAGPVDIGFTVDFGSQYSQLFVNDNGNVTFGAGSLRFEPGNLTAARNNPIIAVFFADVDTRAGGGQVAYGTGVFDGRSAFGVTWSDVDFHTAPHPEHNSFQLLLVERSDTGAGNFDIIFNYDDINWDTGSASYGVSAGVGYSDAAGVSNQLDGSFETGAFLNNGPYALAFGSNVGIEGRYVFEIRPVPEPETYAMLLAGLSIVGFVARRRRQA